jgi:hypothetical protein
MEPLELLESYAQKSHAAFYNLHPTSMYLFYAPYYNQYKAKNDAKYI